jgi:hypothetical protein
MGDEPIHGEHSQDKSGNAAKNKSVPKRNTFFDWSFFAEHPAAIWLMLIGGIAVSPIVDFPGGDPRKVYWIAGGFVCFVILAVWFVSDAIVGRLEGRENLTRHAIEKADQDYKDGIQSQLKSLKADIGDAKKQISAQDPRTLSASQQEAIKKAIAPFQGQRIKLQYVVFDTETNRYAQDFASVFMQSKWNMMQSDNMAFPLDFYNLQVHTATATKADEIPPAALALRKVLIDLGLAREDGAHYMYDEDQRGIVYLRIAPKPEPSTAQTPAK